MTTGALAGPFRMIVAGVGGQGTLTLAQVVMEVARRAGAFALQSEIHGMSQRGGSVHACLTMAPFSVSTAVIMDGTGDLLLALEPVEALRWVPLLRRDAPVLVATEFVRTPAGYPEEASLRAALATLPGCEIVETDGASRTFRFKQAAGMVLLGRAAGRLPFPRALWDEVIGARLADKGATAVARSLDAFRHGYASAEAEAGKT